MNPERPLAGRTALITGASRGIGAASARALAAMGATVIATYRSDRAAAEKLSVRIQTEHGVPAHAVPFDLTAPDGKAPTGCSSLLHGLLRVSTFSWPTRPLRIRRFRCSN